MSVVFEMVLLIGRIEFTLGPGHHVSVAHDEVGAVLVRFETHVAGAAPGRGNDAPLVHGVFRVQNHFGAFLDGCEAGCLPAAVGQKAVFGVAGTAVAGLRVLVREEEDRCLAHGAFISGFVVVSDVRGNGVLPEIVGLSFVAVRPGDPGDGQHSVVVSGVDDARVAQFAELADAFGPACRFPGLVECRQQHRRQDGDDRNNHEYHLLNIHYGNILFYQ